MALVRAESGTERQPAVLLGTQLALREIPGAEDVPVYRRPRRDVRPMGSRRRKSRRAKARRTRQATRRGFRDLPLFQARPRRRVTPGLARRTPEPLPLPFATPPEGQDSEPGHNALPVASQTAWTFDGDGLWELGPEGGSAGACAVIENWPAEDETQPDELESPAYNFAPPGRRPRRSLHPAKITLAEKATWEPLTPGWDAERPRTRGDCKDGPRPCPWASCRHHLLLEVSEDFGTIKLNHPGKSLDELEDTCALDVADRVDAGTAPLFGREKLMPLEKVGAHLGLTLERARQIEASSLEELKVKLRRMEREEDSQ